MIYAGVHFWSMTHRTVLTMLDSVASSADGEAVRIDNNDPWFDWGFIFRRVAAAAILVVGIATLCWAMVFMRKKTEHDSAT